MYITADEFRGSGSMPMIAQATDAAIPDSELETRIEQASRFFDLVCGVEPEYFEAAGASATARTFYGNGTNFLKLDRYVPGSLNLTLTYPDGYTEIDFVERDGYLQITDTVGVLASRSGCSPYGWYSGVPITVTAKWGFAATPADVKHAIIELVANLWRETDPANVKLINIEGQPLREKLPPRVWEIARRYRANAGVLV